MALNIIAEITRRDLGFTNIPAEAVISDVQQLSSYNWVEAPTPTIAVPGSPSLWSPPLRPRRLPKDSGFVYIAQNAARHPESPLEPLFRALYASKPTFDIRTSDIVTDRNNIRKILSFVDPSSSRNGLEPFTIKLEVVKDTVMFCRDEPATHEVIGRNDFRGFGHNFEKAYTTNKINGSTGHHRIISYRFGGLNFIIRHETDGYDGSDLGTSPSIEDSLSAALASTSLSSAGAASSPAGPGSKLSVRMQGETIPLKSTIEIKTRVQHKPLPMQEAAAQLWVSQTPKLVRAYHRQGIFQNPRVEDVMAEITKWEKTNQAHLRRLAGLITEILAVVKERCKGGSAVLKYDALRDALVISAAGDKKMLPGDLYRKWDCTGQYSANGDMSGTQAHTRV